MQLQISWNAGWAGNHDVCYRVQGTVPYTCDTVVATLGPNSTIIVVPDNFCGDVTYEGYILAECQGAATPAEGTQFSILIAEKPDNCEPYQVDCDNAPLASLAATGGTLYVPGDAIMADAIQVGDVATVDGGGAILTVNFTDPVTTFSAIPVMTIVSGAGTLAVITAPLEACRPLLEGCDGANSDGTPMPGGITPIVQVGEWVRLCAEVAPTPAPAAQYTVTALEPTPGFETCHCEDCVELEVDNPTGDDLYIYYTTYDPGLGAIVFWEQLIVAGAANVIIPNQVIEDSVSSQAGLVIAVSPCPPPV